MRIYIDKVLKAIFFILLIFFKCQLVLSSNLKLPAIIDSNMVLQQLSSCTFWGWAEPGDSVMIRVNWNEERKFCIANLSGKWKLDIDTPASSGPYEIIIKADTTYILKNILIGEVWVCSGQSNMQMPFNGYLSMPVNGSNDYIAHGDNNNIRLFTVERRFSTTPLDDCNGEWIISNPAEVAKFSAVAYSFGKYIQEIIDQPVGLILSSWGGTPAEAWTDEETLKSDFKKIDLSVLQSDKVSAKSPTVLFNSMISPIINTTIRGVIWYQGTSNRKRPEQYSRLFPAMIQNWRERWNLGDFPFYFVQIAPYSYRHDTNTQSALLREVQLKTMLNTHNTGMAVTMDIGDFHSNHPADKIPVGKRLAYWALAKTYGMDGLSFSGPVLKAMTVKEGKAILTFDYANFGLTSFGKELNNFVLAGDDKIFYPAKVTIKDTALEVWSTNVKNPVAVRYCWENYAKGTLFNNAGLPASSFRTDNWDK